MEKVRKRMEKDWYRVWFDSPYYHQLYRNRDEAEARQFIEALLKYLSPPAEARILDLACGKGRYSRFLAQKGFIVTGLDLSPESIEAARAFEGPKLSFFQHDMRVPFRINYFDYIFSFFTSFGYFDRSDGDLRTLRSVQAGLRPGGQFVLDFFNSEYVTRRLTGRETKQQDGVTFHLHKYVEEAFVFKDIRIEDGEKTHFYREKVRLYRREELEKMFAQAGLRIQSVFGDYQLAPFRESDSPRLILLAQKDA